jgi:predicted HAD superfamily hydrolase
MNSSYIEPSIVLSNPKLKRLLESTKVVSFDFFDTLFTRPVKDPEHVFEIMALRHGLPDFTEKRKMAQTDAFQRMHAAAKSEITLDDIYSCISYPKQFQAELMASEYNIELSILIPIQEVVELFQYLNKIGREVIITSDMYFSKQFFLDVLKKHGLPIVQLYISCECNATKRDSGEIFNCILNDLNLNASDLLHIGDNSVSDFDRASEKGICSYLYKTRTDKNIKYTGLIDSISCGLHQSYAEQTGEISFFDIGFIYGGPAAIGFLNWLKSQFKKDKIDHVLFLSRDGFILDKIYNKSIDEASPRTSYFLGSRTLFTLAGITDNNFSDHIPFFISGAQGLAPRELLERIGVTPPSLHVLRDLGMGDDVTVSTQNEDKIASFLYALRWEILKVCQKNRRALYSYLKTIGINNGSRVGFVDVGWRGTTQIAFENVVHKIIDAKIFGYYLCLVNKFDSSYNMSAMLCNKTISTKELELIYKNRVIVEQFFTAPHDTVIGLTSRPQQSLIDPVFDQGRQGWTMALKNQDIASEFCNGIEMFANHFFNLPEDIKSLFIPMEMIQPMIGLTKNLCSDISNKMSQIQNFDAWGSSRNFNLTVKNY